MSLNHHLQAVKGKAVQFFQSAKGKVKVLGIAVAAALALPLLSATESQAALPADVQAVVTAVQTAFTDLTSAVGSLGLSIVALAVTIVGITFFVGYLRSGGKG